MIKKARSSVCKRRSKRKHNEHWLVEGMERGEGEGNG